MNHIVREGYEGTGPGAITPDGCAVELYRRISAEGEPEIVARAVAGRLPGARLLELGSGAGRLTRPLTELGFEVTAVDESEEMLDAVREAVPGIRTVRSPIESLDLTGEERFDVVLLASFLVHAGTEGVREGMLDACRRHVADEGWVIVQREADGRHEGLPRERRAAGGELIRAVSSEPSPDEGRPGSRSLHVEYYFPDAKWTQTYLSCPLTEKEFEEALAGAGLVVDAYLDEQRSWARARVAAPGR
ncbi:class I SAM-dependent methyltransferase [Streptomyces sp. NPDC051561]|uniref:class I SAM-dependent methyltransferase n=1 Tax=Streptomyces sp. NPDC051561 TaxID=3365658 RepID=UPI00378C4A1B